MPKTPSKKGSSPVLRSVMAGLMSAIFLILAFPPFSFWGFAFLIPFPLFMLARSTRTSPRKAAIWGAVGSLPGWIWTHLWVNDVSSAGFVPLVLLLGFYTFLFIWIARHCVDRLGRDLIVLPVVWVAVEFFRGAILWGGYPWYLIAHPLIDSPMGLLAMPASWGGVYFVSFLCAMYCMLLLTAMSAKQQSVRLRTGVWAGGFFTLWIAMGALMIPVPPTGVLPVRFGLIQPNIPQDVRSDWTVRQRVRDWHALRDLTLAAASDPKNPDTLDVIVWPEGFVPGWTLDPLSLETERSESLAWGMTPRTPSDVPELIGMPSKIRATHVVDQMLEMQSDLDIPMVVGSVAFDNLRIVDTEYGIEYQRDAMYNSVFLLLDGQPQPLWYDKLHLTPFGEVMPYISSWTWLEQRLLALGASGMDFALDAGKNPVVLTVPLKGEFASESVTLATPVCFEATMSKVCRKLSFKAGKRQAQVLVNITNDGWFGKYDSGRMTHLLSARWRCVELRMPMVRSANTGISCAIDNRGQVISQDIVPLTPQDPRHGYQIVDILPAQGATVYAHLGDSFGWVCFLVALSLVFRANFRRS